MAGALVQPPLLLPEVTLMQLTRPNPRYRPVGDYLLMALLVVGGLLFLLVLAYLTAVAPELVIKITPVFVLAAVVGAAMLARSDKPVGEGFRRWWLILLLATLAFWPSYLLVKSPGLPALEGRRLVVGFTLLLALYFMVARRPVSRALFSDMRNPVRTGAWLVGLYAVWRLASCFASPAPFFSFIQVVWEVLYYTSLFYIGVMFFADDKSRGVMTRALLVLSLLITAFAIGERVLGKNLLVSLAPQNAEYAANALALNTSRIRDGVFRTQGTFEHPLLLAEFSALVACFAAASVLWPGQRRFDRLLGALALVGSALCAYLSVSRSAYVAFAVGLGLVVLLRVFARFAPGAAAALSIKRLLILLFSVGALVLSVPLVTVLAQGNTKGDARSSEGRLVMLKLGLPAIADSPLLGKGPGSGASVAGIRTGDNLTTLDNYLLAIALESGVPALVFFVGALLWPVWRIFLTVTAGAGRRGAFLTATAGGLLAILAMRTILWMPFNMSFACLLMGMALVQCQRADLERGRT